MLDCNVRGKQGKHIRGKLRRTHFSLNVSQEIPPGMLCGALQWWIFHTARIRSFRETYVWMWVVPWDLIFPAIWNSSISLSLIPKEPRLSPGQIKPLNPLRPTFLPQTSFTAEAVHVGWDAAQTAGYCGGFRCSQMKHLAQRGEPKKPRWRSFDSWWIRPDYIQRLFFFLSVLQILEEVV